MIIVAASIVLWIILVVAFFQLVGDVRKIKDKIITEGDEYYHYMGLAKEEHYLGNTEKEREYLIRAQSHARHSEQESAVRTLLDALDRTPRNES